MAIIGQKGLNRVKSTNPLLAVSGTTIFEVMSRLARETGALNLGQGFPDGNGPEDVVARAQVTLSDRANQYPPMLGVPELRQAVAAHNKRFYGIEVDWQTQVVVTSGATEALAASIFALVAPGDEVILFEPLYDTYAPVVRQAGGTPVFVRLEAPDWSIPEAKLRAAFGPKTKAILLNTPMNPTGKVFSLPELTLIADLVKAHDTYAICDEVYEHLAFGDKKHVPLMSLPGMAERTIRIGSAGKTFSLTGWKVGYLTCPPDLIATIGKAHQLLTFTTPPNLQHAVAYGLSKDTGYFDTLASDMAGKRDRLAAGLIEAGFKVLPGDGTYFLICELPSDLGISDAEFCLKQIETAGVVAIPVSAFYDSAPPTNLIRFCFCKSDGMLDQAVERLVKHAKG